MLTQRIERSGFDILRESCVVKAGIVLGRDRCDHKATADQTERQIPERSALVLRKKRGKRKLRLRPGETGDPFSVSTGSPPEANLTSFLPVDLLHFHSMISVDHHQVIERNLVPILFPRR